MEETANHFINNTAIYSPFFDHVAEAWDKRQQPNVFFTTFEKLLKVCSPSPFPTPCWQSEVVLDLLFVLQDFKNETRKMAQFLGKTLTEEQVEMIAHHCNFDAMKNNDNVNRINIHKAGHWDFNISPFMRKGRSKTPGTVDRDRLLRSIASQVKSAIGEST